MSGLLELLHKYLKPLPSPPLPGEGASFFPAASGGLRGVNSTFARGLLKVMGVDRPLNPPIVGDFEKIGFLESCYGLHISVNRPLNPPILGDFETLKILVLSRIDTAGEIHIALHIGQATLIVGWASSTGNDIGFSAYILAHLTHLNPLILGDFEWYGSPPKLGGWGAKYGILRLIGKYIYTVGQATLIVGWASSTGNDIGFSAYILAHPTHYIALTLKILVPPRIGGLGGLSVTILRLIKRCVYRVAKVGGLNAAFAS